MGGNYRSLFTKANMTLPRNVIAFLRILAKSAKGRERERQTEKWRDTHHTLKNWEKNDKHDDSFVLVRSPFSFLLLNHNEIFLSSRINWLLCPIFVSLLSLSPCFYCVALRFISFRSILLFSHETIMLLRTNSVHHWEGFKNNTDGRAYKKKKATNKRKTVS